MTNEEVFDDDFYQEDFSTASEWEAFLSRLSDLLETYENDDEESLSTNELSLCEWKEDTEDVNFNDFELIITRYKAMISPRKRESTEKSINQVISDLMSIENDFCLLDVNYLKYDDYEMLNSPKVPSIHPIAVYYGLRDFVVIKSKRSSLTDTKQIKLLQSSLSIAVNESKCKIPAFIQVLYKEQDFYIGLYEFAEQRLLFDSVHLKTTPPACKYLSGLLDLFRGKVGVSYINASIMVSVCFTYSLKTFFSATYKSEKKSDNDDWDIVDFINSISTLPFGVSADPLNELLLYTKWPHVSENVVFDSQAYSDFNPINAQKWSIRARFDYTPVCYLSDMLHEYLTLTESPEALSEYYFFLNSKQRINDANPFASLTDTRLSSLSGTIGSYSIDGPLNELQLKKMFQYLLPDEDEENKYPYPEIKEKESDTLKIKSAFPDSLVHRLSILLANIYTSFSGRRGCAQFWTEFSQKLRERVDNCHRIPGIANGFPDMRSCLLHQKLQMLNVCMERRNIREGKLPFAMQNTSQQHSNLGKTDSDDEFFDCDDDRVVDEEAEHAHQSPWNPVGRISKLGKMLLIDADEPLYIPVTQDPVPKTEDELEDDAEMLLNVTDSGLRAQLMSASLLSDMESFKAANPLGKLEDFIRWYSPRDWVEEDSNDRDPFGRKGHLSDRMMIPGNTWQTVWDSAKAVPARRQKRLFDDTKEAQKVLHFFESQTLGNIGQLTIVPLLHSAILRLQKELEGLREFIPNSKEMEEKLKQTCCNLSREKWNYISKKKWESVTNDISAIELAINQTRSILLKLYPEQNFFKEEDKKLINSLMKCHDTELTEGVKNDIGMRVMYMFNLERATTNEQHVEDKSWSLPDPIEKNFTLRLSGNTFKHGGPQFLRAILSSNEFRLCGAFSQNTTFAYSS